MDNSAQGKTERKCPRAHLRSPCRGIRVWRAFLRQIPFKSSSPLDHLPPPREFSKLAKSVVFAWVQRLALPHEGASGVRAVSSNCIVVVVTGLY